MSWTIEQLETMDSQKATLYIANDFHDRIFNQTSYSPMHETTRSVVTYRKQFQHCRQRVSFKITLSC